MVGAYAFLFVSEVFQRTSEISSSDLGAFQLFLIAIIALLLAAGLGAVIFQVFIEPFTSHGTLLPFVATVAAGKILENLVAILFGVNVQSISSSVDSYDLGFGFITGSQIFTIISAIVVLSLLALLVNHTVMGRRIRAVQASPVIANAQGINTTRTLLTVFIISSVLAAFAGILAGYETSLQPTMGGSYTVKALAVMILGGLGNIWGTIIASYALATLETIIVGVDFGSVSIPIGYRDGIAFVIILGMLLWRPKGILARTKRRGSV